MRIEIKPPKLKLFIYTEVEYKAFAAAMFEDWLDCEFSDTNTNTRTRALVAVQNKLAQDNLRLPVTLTAGAKDGEYLERIIGKYSQSTLSAAARLITSGSVMFESCRERLELGHTAAAMGKILHDEIEVALFAHDLNRNKGFYPPKE